jgi:aminopeptidase N
MLLTPLGDTDPQLLQIAMVHELTHAAFSSDRPWIFEGLAHFMQAAFREQQQNREAALDFMGLHRAAVMDAEKGVNSKSKDPSSPEGSLISTANEAFYRSKAAYVWWMLRDMLGDEALKRALASYRHDQDTDPAYLQHLLEGQSKRNLQWFFDDWVYNDRGLPDFRVESAFARKASQDNYLVTVTVENLGAAAEVPVKVEFDGGEMSQRIEVRGKEKATVRIATPKSPKQIVVNDGSVPESDLSNNTYQVAAPAQ